MAKARPYIRPGGDEIDCAYDVSAEEYARGFLRLPSTIEGEVGRLRFTEDVHRLHGSDLDAIPFYLLDNATGTRACALDCFVSRHRIQTPTPPPFPLELVVNAVLIGSDDASQQYPEGVLRCAGLVRFLDGLELSPSDVTSGKVHAERARATGEDWAITLAESIQMDQTASELSIRWRGELAAHSESKTAPDWGRTLTQTLHLFSFLGDSALCPDQICAVDGPRRVDYYASWPEPKEYGQAVPLVTLAHVGDQFGDIVANWRRLRTDAEDLLYYLAEFQLHRERLTLRDSLLVLVRCLELYHAHGRRFTSTNLSKEKHRALVKQIAEALPSELAENLPWIKNAVTEANRKRLADQIKDVLTHLGAEIVARCRVDDAALFASTAAKARNRFTHPAGKEPKGIPEGRDLVVFTNRLWFVVRACVLLELGLSREDVAAALQRSAQRHYLLD